MSRSRMTPLRLALYGFNDRGRETLRLALEGPGKKCAILVDEESAEASVFNMDSVDAKRLWETYRKQFPHRPTIVMGINNTKADNTIYIPKPVRIDAMMQAVKKIKNCKSVVLSTPQAPANDQEQNATVITPSPITRDWTLFEGRPQKPKKQNQTDFNSKTKFFYEPQKFIQRIIFNALEVSNKSDTAMQLNVLSGSNTWDHIVFLPGENRISSSMSEDQLKQLCTTPLCLIRHSLRRCMNKETLYEIQNSENNKDIETFESFKLKVVLWTSMGRVPSGTDLTTPVVLNRWPNLTRLPFIPNSMRIAALLIDQPRPLPLIAKVLNLPLVNVFSFYCSALTLGLVSTVTEGGEITLTTMQPQKQHRHHSLFGNILNHLRREN